MIEPRMTITLLGFPFAALLDTGAAISLIGDAAYELCKNQKITFRSADTPLQLASGSTISADGAVRLKISFNEKKQRQRFLYLPGLAVPVILGRDFIAGVDFPGGGYCLGNQADLTPLTKRENCITGPTLPAHFTTPAAVLFDVHGATRKDRHPAASN
uniref:Putative transposon ty3-i gag-pol polyprotein n=1 Tax=Ixodes ricinus TaxID=34613 RepID=A0A6B0UX33_IXORI